MSRTIMIVIVATVIAAIAVIGYTSRNNNASPEPTAAPTPTPTAENPEDITSASLLELTDFESNQECTFTDAETETEGVIYTGENRFRGEFAGIVDGEPFESDMISDGENMFIWYQGTGEGFQVSMSDLQMIANLNLADDIIDLDQEVDYECRPWEPDESFFELPEDVEFQDFSGMIPG